MTASTNYHSLFMYYSWDALYTLLRITRELGILDNGGETDISVMTTDIIKRIEE